MSVKEELHKIMISAPDLHDEECEAWANKNYHKLLDMCKSSAEIKVNFIDVEFKKGEEYVYGIKKYLLQKFGHGIDISFHTMSESSIIMRIEW